MIIYMKIGWLVNDVLTCIPNTKTFWHFLLENIDGLIDKTYNDYPNLATKIENDYKYIKPTYIIRNASYFRKINIDCYTISLLQDVIINNQMQINVLNNSNLIVCNSQYVLDKYIKYINKPYKIIPLGTDFDFFKPSNDINNNVLPNSILFIGSSLNYPKGFDKLMNIIDNMSEQNFCLIMKDDFKIKHNRIKVFNRISQQEVVKIINSCLMGICTSIEETQHLSGIEICACNKPMVGTNVGFYYDNKDNQEWGLIANDNNFIEKINYVLNNLNKFNPREYLIKKGYTVESCKKNWLEIIDKI